MKTKNKPAWQHLIESLPKEYATRAIARLFNETNHKLIAASPADAVDAFIWSNTPEGHEFWSEVGDFLFHKTNKLPSFPEDSHIAPGWNPEKFTEEKVGIAEGWRLLSVEEARWLQDANNTKPIEGYNTLQAFAGDGWSGGYSGGADDFTYRTREPEGFFLPKSLFPWTLETVPKGHTLIRKKTETKTYLIIAWHKEGVSTIKHYKCDYSTLLADFEYSFDYGLTWHPCGTSAIKRDESVIGTLA